MIYLVRTCSGSWQPLWMFEYQLYAGLASGDHGAPYCRIRWFPRDALLGGLA